MKTSLKTLPILLVLSAGMMAGSASAQHPETDSTFEAKMDSAWADIKKHENSDSLQKEYAQTFYDYYLEHQETETGQNAIRSAFMMWGNIGAAAPVDEALTHLDYDSEIWAQVIHSVSNAYYRADRDREQYIKLLKELKPKLTHPNSRSAVILEIADYNKRNDRKERAKEQYQNILTIDTDSFYVIKAKGNIHEINNLQIGQQAPDFNATTLDGERIKLSELHGKTVLLEFWATWCGPCKPNIPHLKKVYSEINDDKLMIVGIALEDNTEKLKEFLAEKDMQWPQILQKRQWHGDIAKKYNVLGIPDSYLIDSEGKIVAKNLREEEIEKEINKLVSK